MGTEIQDVTLNGFCFNRVNSRRGANEKDKGNLSSFLLICIKCGEEIRARNVAQLDECLLGLVSCTAGTDFKVHP